MVLYFSIVGDYSWDEKILFCGTRRQWAMCTASAQSAAISTFTLTFWVFQIPHRIRYSPYRSKNEARATNKPQTDFIEFTQNAAIFIWHPFQFIHIIPVIVDDTTGRTYKTLHCKVISTSSPLVCRYRCGYGLGKESVTKKKYDRHQPQYLYSTTTTSFTLCLSTHWSWCYFSIINFHNDDDDDFYGNNTITNEFGTGSVRFPCHRHHHDCTRTHQLRSLPLPVLFLSNTKLNGNDWCMVIIHKIEYY